jgi:hypothetical protein
MQLLLRRHEKVPLATRTAAVLIVIVFSGAAISNQPPEVLYVRLVYFCACHSGRGISRYHVLAILHTDHDYVCHCWHSRRCTTSTPASCLYPQPAGITHVGRTAADIPGADDDTQLGAEVSA